MDPRRAAAREDWLPFLVPWTGMDTCSFVATLTALVAVAGCARAPSERAPVPAAVATSQGVKPSPTTAEPAEWVSVIPTPGHLVSPDDRLVLTDVRLEPRSRRALAVYETDRPDAPPRIMAVGSGLLLERFLAPRRVLAKTGGKAVTIDVDSGEMVALGPQESLASSSDGSRAVSVRDGLAVIVDTATGEVRQELAALPGGRSPVEALGWAAGDRLIFVKASRGAGWFDAKTGGLRLDVPDLGVDAQPLFTASASGRWVAHAVPKAGELPVAEVVDLSTGRVVGTSPLGFGSMAFSPDERVFASSVHPAVLSVMDLATGAVRDVGTAARTPPGALDSMLVLRHLAISRDGRHACGRIATTIEKYGDGHSTLLYDNATGGAPRGIPGLVSHCFADAGVATVIATRAPRPPRALVANVQASNSWVQNGAASADRRVVAAIDALPTVGDDDMLVRPEVGVTGSDGVEMARLELPPAPRTYGARLFLDLSRTGRWLLVQLGQEIRVVDVARKAFLELPGELPEIHRLGVSPGESLLLVEAEDCAFAYRLPDGERLALGCNDAPSARRACLVGDRPVHASACGEAAPAPP